MGVVNLLILPMTFAFMIVQFILVNAEELHRYVLSNIDDDGDVDAGVDVDAGGDDVDAGVDVDAGGDDVDAGVDVRDAGVVDACYVPPFICYFTLHPLLLPPLYLPPPPFSYPPPPLCSNRGAFASRTWSLEALWAFRRFNELPHSFQARTKAAATVAQSYLAAFPSSLISLVAAFVSFVSASFVAVIILLSFGDSSALTGQRVLERPLLWYLAVFTAMLALSRALLTQDSTTRSPRALMRALVRRAGLAPTLWVQSPQSAAVRAQVASLFHLRLKAFACELVATILTPFVLMSSVRDSSLAIIDHINTVSDFFFFLFVLSCMSTPVALSFPLCTSLAFEVISIPPYSLSITTFSRDLVTYPLQHTFYVEHIGDVTVECAAEDPDAGVDVDWTEEEARDRDVERDAELRRRAAFKAIQMQDSMGHPWQQQQQQQQSALSSSFAPLAGSSYPFSSSSSSGGGRAGTSGIDLDDVGGDAENEPFAYTTVLKHTYSNPGGNINRQIMPPVNNNIRDSDAASSQGRLTATSSSSSFSTASPALAAAPASSAQLPFDTSTIGGASGSAHGVATVPLPHLADPTQTNGVQQMPVFFASNPVASTLLQPQQPFQLQQQSQQHHRAPSTSPTLTASSSPSHPVLAGSTFSLLQSSALSPPSTTTLPFDAPASPPLTATTSTAASAPSTTSSSTQSATSAGSKDKRPTTNPFKRPQS